MRRTLLVLVMLVVVGVLGGCTGMGGTNSAQFIDGSGITIVDRADREAPVDIKGASLTDQPIDVAADRGKVVVLNVWWSECGPCIAEMPRLVSAEHQLEVPFVGIDIRDVSKENGIAFQNAQGVDYPSIFDPGSTTLLGLGRYQPAGPPTTYVLDTQGRVAAVFSGGIPSSQTLVDVVGQIAAERG